MANKGHKGDECVTKVIHNGTEVIEDTEKQEIVVVQAEIVEVASIKDIEHEINDGVHTVVNGVCKIARIRYRNCKRIIGTIVRQVRYKVTTFTNMIAKSVTNASIAVVKWVKNTYNSAVNKVQGIIRFVAKDGKVSTLPKQKITTEALILRAKLLQIIALAMSLVALTFIHLYNEKVQEISNLKNVATDIVDSGTEDKVEVALSGNTYNSIKGIKVDIRRADELWGITTINVGELVSLYADGEDETKRLVVPNNVFVSEQWIVVAVTDSNGNRAYIDISGTEDSIEIYRSTDIEQIRKDYSGTVLLELGADDKVIGADVMEDVADTSRLVHKFRNEEGKGFVYVETVQMYKIVMEQQ